MRYGAVDITGKHSRTGVPSKDQCGSHEKNRSATVDAAVNYVGTCHVMRDCSGSSVGIFGKTKDDR